MTSSAAGELRARYAAALARHVEQRDEVSLSAAYEVGRMALARGVGLLDLVALHQEALHGVARDRSSAADDFQREALSPYEMALSGYRTANDDLRATNASLVREREAAEAANRELESFSYAVSHDLRAPLRTIDGFSLALLEDNAPQLDEQGKRYLGFVREAAQRMGDLIDDLLELSRVTRTELRRERVEVSAAAERIVERLRAGSPGRRVQVTIEPGIVVEGDSRLFGSVLENLLGNAWKFTSKRPEAHIEVGKRETDREIACFVRDDGAGFDMTYAAKLFGAFQRLHDARDFEGTGIGLATVQRIVNRHGGRVWAEGEVGRGATFWFALPRAR
jgi:signal transduction histidine kinase